MLFFITFYGENSRKKHTFPNSKNHQSQSKIPIFFSANGGYDRYSSVPFSSYFQSMFTDFPTEELELFNFYTYVEDPEYLNKRVDIEHLKSEFDEKEFAKTVHNYLTLVYHHHLVEFIERMSKENGGLLLIICRKFSRCANF